MSKKSLGTYPHRAYILGRETEINQMIAYIKINVYLKHMLWIVKIQSLEMRDEGNESERVRWDQKEELTRWRLLEISFRDFFFVISKASWMRGKIYVFDLTPFYILFRILLCMFAWCFFFKNFRAALLTNVGLGFIFSPATTQNSEHLKDTEHQAKKDTDSFFFLMEV